MAEYAAAYFALEVRQEDGYSLRAHLESAWEQTGIKPPELEDLPELMPTIAYLWEYFIELHNRRGNYGWGHVPLLFSEMEAWARLTKTTLDPWELKAILDVDTAYLASIAKSKPEGST